MSSDRSTARLEELLGMCAQGQLAVTVRTTYPLDAAADAHQTGHGRGEVVLVFGSEVQ